MNTYSGGTLSDTSEEESDGHTMTLPAKRLMTSTLRAASSPSHSSSSSNDPGVSDDLSQSESDGEIETTAPTGAGRYKSCETDFSKDDAVYSENGNPSMDSLVYIPGKGLSTQEHHIPKPQMYIEPVATTDTLIRNKEAGILKDYSADKSLRREEHGRPSSCEDTVQRGSATFDLTNNSTERLQNSKGLFQIDSESEIRPASETGTYKRHGNEYLNSENEKSAVDSPFCKPGKRLMTQEQPIKRKRQFEQPPRKSIISDKAENIMRSMGYSPGKGLGKLQQGRTAPIEASTQKGRTGFGFQNMLGKLPQDIEWDPESDFAQAKETPLWMPSPPSEDLSSDTLEDWLKEGPIKLTIDDETNFCEPDILRHVLSSKSIFDNLKAEDLRRARTRSNPYETIASAFFLNRAAVKMANMDAVFDFMFTNPKNKDGTKVLDNNKLLYFADVCAGPGGFSEYVLWRKKWRAKGFGFTLKAANDFKLGDFYAGPPETFTPYYGVQDNGDITDPENLESLKDYVLKYSEDLGVHFLMADGGFSVENQENIQEILSKKLYLCQCIAALYLIRPGGHFVVKLFDLFTPFSVGLIYLMYRSFDQVCIHKPRTSRPANSERYLICKWKKTSSDVIGRHLARVNHQLWTHQRLGEVKDIVQLVPLSIIKEDTGFFNYICESNNTLGGQQVQALLKIAAFCKDDNLIEHRQASIRTECLELWKLPSEVRKAPQRYKVDEMISAIMKLMNSRLTYASDVTSFKANVLNKIPTIINKMSSIKDKMHSVYDWNFVFVDHSNSSTNVGHGSFFLGLGGMKIKEIPEEGNWIASGDLFPKLPALTLVWGETVGELKNERKAQQRSKSIHLVDALVIGGEPVAHLHITDRHKQLQLLCSALDNGHSPIRCKRLWALEDAERAFQALETRIMKNGFPAAVSLLPRQLKDTTLAPYHAVGGILLLEATKEPWHCFMSKKHDTKYFYCPKKPSLFWDQKPPEACLHALETHQKRLLWRWEPPSEVLRSAKPPENTENTKDELRLYSFYEFLREKM